MGVEEISCEEGEFIFIGSEVQRKELKILAYETDVRFREYVDKRNLREDYQ